MPQVRYKWSICLKILSTDCLLVAIGNELHYYQLGGGGTVHKHQATNLFDKIHGIQRIQKSVNEYYVIVYGGRELAIIQIKDLNFIVIKSVQLSDWINNINFYENEPDSFCCLTSHSVALNFSIVWNQEDLGKAMINLSNKLSCPDKSTLYSSLILGTTWNSTLFFGGTALGDVFIWREIDNEVVVLHRLTGHNGVIFSINCNIEHSIMTTTSDDRSVETWKISFNKDLSWSNCTIKPMKSLYGHTARVFRSKIIVENDVPYIISIGEDSNICIWTESGSLLYRRHFNCGATLWNLDYNTKLKTLFVCGSDGNVREVRLGNVFNGLGLNKDVISTEFLWENEYLSKIKLLDNNKIVALTSENRLVYQNECNNWMVCSFEFYKSCLLEKFERYIAIAGYRRASVFQYDANFTLRLIYDIVDLQNMVRSFTFLNENEYLLCDDSGNCTLIDQSSNKKRNFSLPTSKDTYITVALIENHFLFVSDRTGDLHLFEIVSDHVHHRHRLKHIHGNLGCTVIISENGNYVTSGHDGTMKIIALNASSMTMSVILTKKLPILWIDRVICRSDNKKLYAGFNDKHFVFANDECDIVDEIDCGGGHRFWDLIVTENAGKFLFIRNKMLHSAVLSGYADDRAKFLQIPKFKWHMKSCNSMKCINLPDNNVIVVSGGDDNILKIHKFNEFTKSYIEHIGDMVQHISCIKAISLIELNQKQWLIVSVGGRAQICISKISINDSEIDTKEVTNFMLNSSDIERKKMGKSQTVDFDPETRFMSATCTEDFHIFTGCSDGYIRHFQFDPAKNQIQTINSIFYGKCLLHTHYLRYEDNKYLLTMATDGLICFWKLNLNNSVESEPFHRLKHHNSGINSFDIIFLQNRFVIATGGDDQSTVISLFHVKEHSIKVIQTNDLHYHTAQVNGAKFSGDGDGLYTISLDQILYKVDLISFKPQSVSNSTIADAKGLHFLQNNQIIVYGCGVQLLNTKKY